MLFVFVEGSDDRRFFEHYYESTKVKIISYKSMTNKKIASYIETANALKYDYLFFADADGATVEQKQKKCHKNIQWLIKQK